MHTLDKTGVSDPMVVTLPTSSFDSAYVAFVDSPVVVPEPEEDIRLPIKARNGAITVICLYFVALNSDVIQESRAPLIAGKMGSPISQPVSIGRF